MKKRGGSVAEGRTRVYVGPSLADRSYSIGIGVDTRPPVRRGDLPTSFSGTIVIIDGLFHQSLAVSPKEILRLLDGGTRVMGAASMGALRAAELWQYGMEGHGWVFESYAAGRLTGDDEVAVACAADDYAPLTVPLVNIRVWLQRLSSEGFLGESTEREMLRRARSIFYADRTFTRLMYEWCRVVDPGFVRALLEQTGGHITDVKAMDAALVLAEAVRSLPDRTPQVVDSHPHAMYMGT